MNLEKQYETLVSFLENLNIDVKSDRGNFKGGLVRYHQDKFIYLNRKLDLESRLKIIIKEIKELNLDKEIIGDRVLKILSAYDEN
jgi:hypothetical protein